VWRKGAARGNRRQTRPRSRAGKARNALGRVRSRTEDKDAKLPRSDHVDVERCEGYFALQRSLRVDGYLHEYGLEKASETCTGGACGAIGRAGRRTYPQADADCGARIRAGGQDSQRAWSSACSIYETTLASPTDSGGALPHDALDALATAINARR